MKAVPTSARRATNKNDKRESTYYFVDKSEKSESGLRAFA